MKRTLDLMACHKYNTLHWHLTEDQGWRLDVPGLPELVQYGSVRAESPCHGATLKHFGNFRYQSSAMDGTRYGPFFYTPADVKEIVSYATARHITVVPEIELPGHSLGAIAAYPNLTCFPEHITAPQTELLFMFDAKGFKNAYCRDRLRWQLWTLRRERLAELAGEWCN